MRKAMRKGYALALLAVFALVLGGAGCCQTYYDQCTMYEQQAKASADRAAASAVKAEAAAQDAKVPAPRAAAAADKAEAAAARAEDAAEKCCANVGTMRVHHHKFHKRGKRVACPPVKKAHHKAAASAAPAEPAAPMAPAK
jgi:phage-related tail fiber protein